jgi:hypothetical protein
MKLGFVDAVSILAKQIKKLALNFCSRGQLCGIDVASANGQSICAPRFQFYYLAPPQLSWQRIEDNLAQWVVIVSTAKPE